MALLGTGALVLALVLAAWAAVAGLLAGLRSDRRLLASARNATYAMLGAVLVADAVFMAAILGHDFSFEVVATTSSRSLPLGYLIGSFWSSQAGSLLLWMTILAVYAALVARGTRAALQEFAPWTTAVMGAISAFFALLLVASASPFATQVAPVDGFGMNPSLQNPYMVSHPPALYLGYVGFSVPFAFMVGALATGRTDARWLVATRRWTLVSWSFLGVGMLLGAHWAYVEVGWGGYWAWDPVENAALLPWLVATAYLHSVMVQEKKGMLKVWNVALVGGTFALCLFGTFLTRSGILDSIHAFAVSSIGTYFVTAIVLVLAATVALIVWRLPLLRAEHRMESLVSREASFLVNNLLFVAMAFAVLWGVLFPIVSERIGGQRLSVSSPFFEFFAVAFGLPLILLMGVGPLVAWRRASVPSLVRTFRLPGAAGLVVGVAMLVLGYGTSVAGLVAISLCAFVAMAIGLEFARGAGARRSLTGESWGRALVHLVGRNRRRYGGYLVHLAVIVLVIGIVGSSAYATSQAFTLAPGASATVRDYTITNGGVGRVEGPNYLETQARLTVRSGGESFDVQPGRRSYPREQITTNEPAIRQSLHAGEDLFVILEGVRPDGSVALKVLINPLVNLIWVASVLFALGCLVAIWPDPREARRVARRYAEETVAHRA